MSKIGGWIFLTIVVLVALAITFPSVRPVDLLAGLGFFSIAVGFAFQDILENTLSGMLLLFRQPFRSGDQIEVMGQSGTVEGITIRETRIIRYDGELVVIPNRDVYKNEIVVHTYRDDHRQHFVVGIAYENDAEEATTAVVAALREVDGVRRDPPPIALVENLNVSTVDIVAMFWTSSGRSDSLLIKDAAIKAVKRRLDEAGIEMPADIVALQATPSFKAALQNEAEVTPGGSLRT
jgi:small-conductance mechanosensitive channel